MMHLSEILRWGMGDFVVRKDLNGNVVLPKWLAFLGPILMGALSAGAAWGATQATFSSELRHMQNQIEELKDIAKDLVTIRERLGRIEGYLDPERRPR
jgi:hypothetical protein